SRPVRIGVASDAAFQFYYAENFDLLREAGAELVFWSPLRDSELPDVDGLYFGGGYPELHARRLAENAAMRKAVRRFAEAGRPVYAECGGLMYLAETLGDADGVAHPMVGVLPAAVRLEPRRMALGYAEVVLTRDTPIGPARAVARPRRRALPCGRRARRRVLGARHARSRGDARGAARAHRLARPERHRDPLRARRRGAAGRRDRLLRLPAGGTPAAERGRHG